MIWVGVLLTCVGCYLLKLAGFLLPLHVLERPAVQRVALLLPVALLAALIAIQTLTSGHDVVVDARLAGAAVAVIALLLRAPFLVVITAAALTAALLRLVG